jgi:hypothetical protein
MSSFSGGLCRSIPVNKCVCDVCIEFQRGTAISVPRVRVDLADVAGGVLRARDLNRFHVVGEEVFGQRDGQWFKYRSGSRAVSPVARDEIGHAAGAIKQTRRSIDNKRHRRR